MRQKTTIFGLACSVALLIAATNANACERVVKPNGQWGIICPTQTSQPHSDRFVQQKPRKLPGFASNYRGKPQPKPQSKRPCDRAVVAAGDELGYMDKWFRKTLYGDPHERVLTARAVTTVKALLREYIMREMRVAESKWIAAPRNVDRNKLCIEHLNAATKELNRVFNLVVAEAKKGNRDLEGTGLNTSPSVYNR